MSGMLIPEDLEPIAEATGVENPLILASKWLSASPGAIVSISGEIMRIGTLVPRRTVNGCQYFEGGSCRIHAVAPFGCSHFSWHMGKEEGDERSGAAIHSIMADTELARAYRDIWAVLWLQGQRADGPGVARAKMRELLK